jgi:hypothetical protein
MQANETLTPCLTRDDVLVHEGAGYRKVKSLAGVGSRIVIVNARRGVSYINGNVLKVQAQYYEAVLATCGRTVYHHEYLVLEPLDPALYHVHGGEVYRKERRKAQADELVLFVNADHAFEAYSNGDVARVTHVDNNGRRFYIDRRWKNSSYSVQLFVWEREYNVLVPLPDANPAPQQSPADATFATIREHFPEMTLQNVLPTIALGMASRARDEYDAQEVRYNHLVDRISEAVDADDVEILPDLHRQQASVAEQRVYWYREERRLLDLADATDEENKRKMAAQNGAA